MPDEHGNTAHTQRMHANKPLQMPPCAGAIMGDTVGQLPSAAAPPLGHGVDAGMAARMTAVASLVERLGSQFFPNEARWVGLRARGRHFLTPEQTEAQLCLGVACVFGTLPQGIAWA